MIEALKKANTNLPTVKIKGKEYVMVKDRVKAFRENFPGWGILTSIVEMDEMQVTFVASVINDEGTTVATGYAQEVAGSTNINKTSHVENCETSAIGRALACLGIGIDDSFGSADEVADAMVQQAADGPCTPQEIQRIKDLLEMTDSDIPAFLKWLNIASVDELTKSQYARAAMKLQKKQEQHG